MKRLFFLAVVCMLFINAKTTLDKTYTVSGKCTISETGKLYIFLVDEEAFKVPLTGYKKIVVDVNSKHIANKAVEFSFDNVEKGKYGIRCFLDKNNNAKLDKGLRGPKEPWGMSWQGNSYKGGFPKFSDIAFPVINDINNINILISIKTAP